jgi:hypothetical protein
MSPTPSTVSIGDSYVPPEGSDSGNDTDAEAGDKKPRVAKGNKRACSGGVDSDNDDMKPRKKVQRKNPQARKGQNQKASARHRKRDVSGGEFVIQPLQFH